MARGQAGGGREGRLGMEGRDREGRILVGSVQRGEALTCEGANLQQGPAGE